ncbi:MAG: LytTR family transcriptional regulator [Halanaerobiaceae bacterium]|jgi:DNA-binding LytR/AlgR family response regulator|nr:LytTR family transcriptional regulator [Halanaerobiaceae bacterium]
MDIKLLCSKNYQVLLEEFLRSRNFNISDNASIHLIESGYPIPEKGISIVFHPDQLDKLVTFLDESIFSNKQSFDFRNGRIVGQYQDSYEIIELKDIILFEASENYVYSLTNDKKYKIKEKLYQLEEMLANSGFIRINKSSIVNILYIKEIVPWFNGRLLLKLNNKLELEVSRNYANDFKKFLGM